MCYGHMFKISIFVNLNALIFRVKFHENFNLHSYFWNWTFMASILFNKWLCRSLFWWHLGNAYFAGSNSLVTRTRQTCIDWRLDVTNFESQKTTNITGHCDTTINLYLMKVKVIIACKFCIIGEHFAPFCLYSCIQSHKSR